MKDCHKALKAFWSGFGMNAYEMGCVPDGAHFPYITFEVAECGPMGATILTAIGWFKRMSGANANDLRASFLDSVKALIAPSGKRLSVGDGICVLYPNDGNFLSYYDDPVDGSVIGGRVSYEIHCYE